MLSAVMEDYLKAIYAIEEETGERVATSALADHLEVTPPTVTSMLKKLEERELVDREEYRGVTLTEEGEVVALEILRHHRLLEAFLTDHLDYDWADVHEEADRLEHHISEEFERRVAEVLGNPAADPHGDPIPSADLHLPDEDATTLLSDSTVGDRVSVRRIRHQSDEDLRYLARSGIEPDTVLEVVDVAPFGMVTVETDAGEQALPVDIARLIEVSTPAASESDTSETANTDTEDGSESGSDDGVEYELQ